MKFATAVVLIMLLSFISGLFFDWWVMAVPAFLVSVLIEQLPWKAFLSGLLAILLLWSGLAFWIDTRNESILSARIGELLGIGGSSFLLILITGLIGGLVGGFASLAGSYLRAGRKQQPVLD
jgi:hypothetical protein